MLRSHSAEDEGRIEDKIVFWKDTIQISQGSFTEIAVGMIPLQIYQPRLVLKLRILGIDMRMVKIIMGGK